MKLQLVRHAQSTANVLAAINTRMPGPPLTDLGHEQAHALAQRLADEPIVAVYSSVATRAQQTAAPLAQRMGLEVHVIDGVHEVDAGDLEDRTDEEGHALFAGVFHPWTQGQLEMAMPGGETGTQIRDRYIEALTQIRAKHEQEHPDGTVVLVSHGGVMRLCAEQLADNVSPDLADVGLIPNTEWIELECLDGGGWHCHSWAGIAVD